MIKFVRPVIKLSLELICGWVLSRTVRFHDFSAFCVSKIESVDYVHVCSVYLIYILIVRTCSFCVSVCVSVCVFRISSQTAGWINFKLSQKMPLASPLKLVDISSRFDKPILHIFGIFYHFLHQCFNWWLSD